jgi:hypothetical protein
MLLRTAVFHPKVFCTFCTFRSTPSMVPHTVKKKVNDFPVPSWDVTLAENNLIIPGQGESG